MPIPKISNLPQATSVADTDLLIIETDEGTKSVPANLIVSELTDTIERLNASSGIASPASYFTTDGAGAITGLTDKGKAASEIVIPNEIDGVAITSIGIGAFDSCTNLTSITIPNSVTSIGSGAFYNCENLTTVYYTGTQEEWDAITIFDSNNDTLINATKVFQKETWTFTLEDGSTVTKKVVLG